MNLDELPLEEAMALAKALEKRIDQARAGLAEEASERWPAKSRIPVRINGELVGWVSVPASHGKVTIKDAAKYLAWVQEHHPTEVWDEHTVPVTEELLDFLRHRGGKRFIVTKPVVNEGFTQKLVHHGKQYGGYKQPGGEVVFDIPGVEIEKEGGALTPKVELGDDDEVFAILARARDAGVIDVAQLLALPSPDVLTAGDMDPELVGRIAGLLELLGHDGCGGWTWNRRTNAVTCKCGARMIPPKPPPVVLPGPAAV